MTEPLRVIEEKRLRLPFLRNRPPRTRVVVLDAGQSHHLQYSVLSTEVLEDWSRLPLVVSNTRLVCSDKGVVLEEETNDLGKKPEVGLKTHKTTLVPGQVYEVRRSLFSVTTCRLE